MNTSAEQVPGPRPLQSIAVIGAGVRGRAFAFRCVQAGFAVVLEDVLSSNLRKAEEEFAREPEALRSRLKLASSVEEAVREADLAVDFLPDELESKLEIFSMMDRMAPPRTIFCTPTTLSIADLASCTYRPLLCVGIEPFGDELGTGVRLVRGRATAESTLGQVTAWFHALGASVDVIFDMAEPILVRS